jgi:BON domain
MRTLLLAITLLGPPAVAQQRAAPLPPAHQRTAPAAQPAPKRLTDAQIEAAIRMKLAKSKIGADKFQFHVQGGVATIEGRTDVIQHKGAATRMAKTAGALAVVNHIQISDAAKQRAEANLAKGRRRAQIKRGDARSDTASVTPRTSTRAPAAPKVNPTEKKTVGASGQNQ